MLNSNVKATGATVQTLTTKQIDGKCSNVYKNSKRHHEGLSAKSAPRYEEHLNGFDKVGGTLNAQRASYQKIPRIAAKKDAQTIKYTMQGS